MATGRHNRLSKGRMALMPRAWSYRQMWRGETDVRGVVSSRLEAREANGRIDWL